jgi:bacteriocin-like protein
VTPADTSRELTSDVRTARMGKMMDDELTADELAHVSGGVVKDSHDRYANS